MSEVECTWTASSHHRKTPSLSTQARVGFHDECTYLKHPRTARQTIYNSTRRSKRDHKTTLDEVNIVSFAQLRLCTHLRVADAEPVKRMSEVIRQRDQCNNATREDEGVRGRDGNIPIRMPRECCDCHKYHSINSKGPLKSKKELQQQRD